MIDRGLGVAASTASARRRTTARPCSTCRAGPISPRRRSSPPRRTCSTSATTPSLRAARSACAATCSRSCRRTRTTSCASSSSATRSSGSSRSIRSPARSWPSGDDARTSTRPRTTSRRATSCWRRVEDIEAELDERVARAGAEERVLEAQRLRQRTMFDLEMMREVGYCIGIENYSRHLARREPGAPPSTLIDYFPDDFLLVVDESPHHHPAGPRHVQRRPRAQGDAGRATASGCRRRWTTGR